MRPNSVFIKRGVIRQRPADAVDLAVIKAVDQARRDQARQIDLSVISAA